MLCSRSLSVIYLKIIPFIHLFLAVLGLCCGMGLSLVPVSGGPFLGCERASHCSVSSGWEAWAPARVGSEHRLRSSGARA